MDGEIVSRSKILAFEDALRQFEQIDLPVQHYFADGIYMRSLFIPAGTCLTGKIHLHEHLNICIGDLSVYTEEGPKRFTGFHIIKSPAGVKRAGFAHTDTTWVCVHPNPSNETDLEKLEAMYVTDTFEALEAPEALTLLSAGG